jgi:hypothetical protein
MEETKGAVRSTTIQGGLLAALPGILQLLSFFGVPYISLIPDAVNLAVSTVGGVLAIIGRAKSEKKIKGLL